MNPSVIAKVKTVARLLVMASVGVSARASAADNEGKMWVRLTPNIAYAPATVQLKVHVPPQAENRRLRVTLDSGVYLRSSDLPLEGDQAAALHLFRWPGVPSGSYVVFVELILSNGKSRMIEAGRIQIVGLAD